MPPLYDTLFTNTDNFNFVAQALQLGLLLGFFVAIFNGNNRA